jgi:predicted ATPase
MARQQTLQATIDWSYNLLSQPERALFRRLAVFAGGWTLEAAEAVCAGDGIDPEEILDLLTRLVDKSLVIGEARGRAKGYRMLETVRQCSGDRLDDSSQMVASRNQHLGSEQRAALDELEAEHTNLLAARAWSAEHEPAAALKLSNALGWFWDERGSLAEGREWFNRTIAQCPTAPADLRGEAHVRAGRAACWQGDYESAVALTEQGLQLCEQSGNQRWAGMALNNLGGGCVLHLADKLKRRPDCSA